MSLNETHDPGLRSWIASANDGQTDFPLQNLPFCVFRRHGSAAPGRVGVGIGDQIVDVAASAAAFDGRAHEAARACEQAALNALMALGPAHASALRLALSRALRSDAPAGLRSPLVLVPANTVELMLPVRVGHFTDFYCSIHHAKACGALFRPDNPLFPNYRWLPPAYHSRPSSIRVSGHPLHRPNGQSRAPGQEIPSFGPSRKVDFELELGVYVGVGNALGHPIAIDEVDDHLFGVSLLNDWSSRDLQQWEATPIGPFVSKSWGTTVSPWVVTMEALEPYRLPWSRAAQDPAPLPYLQGPRHAARAHLDIELRVFLQTERMRAAGEPAVEITASNTRHLYWSVAQMLAHHTSSGCDFLPGDLYGTGTLSGPAPEQAGSLLELSVNGARAIELPNGERRTFVEDGDTLSFTGQASRPGAPRIGFGPCEARILPALTLPCTGTHA